MFSTIFYVFFLSTVLLFATVYANTNTDVSVFGESLSEEEKPLLVPKSEDKMKPRDFKCSLPLSSTCEQCKKAASDIMDDYKANGYLTENSREACMKYQTYMCESMILNGALEIRDLCEEAGYVVFPEPPLPPVLENDTLNGADNYETQVGNNNTNSNDNRIQEIIKPTLVPQVKE